LVDLLIAQPFYYLLDGFAEFIVLDVGLLCRLREPGGLEASLGSRIRLGRSSM
jgi:hypothetical protein